MDISHQWHETWDASTEVQSSTVIWHMGLESDQSPPIPSCCGVGGVTLPGKFLLTLLMSCMTELSLFLVLIKV